MNQIFCQKLKEARKETGLTQKNIADILKVVESCYANWEQGRTEPSITDLKNLCQILNVSADYLLGLSNHETNDWNCKIL